MFSISEIFRRRSHSGRTIRNSYLDNHGYYKSEEDRKPISRNGHSAPAIPYAVTDLLESKLNKEMSIFVRWDIYSYRWALHRGGHASSCCVKLKKKSSSGHRHFVRNSSVSAEELAAFSSDHQHSFDLMIFDGPDKHKEVPVILNMLAPRGIVIMTDDFSDPYDFDRALEQFTQAGFKSFQITNPAPLFHELTAAVLYRAENFVGF